MPSTPQDHKKSKKKGKGQKAPQPAQPQQPVDPDSKYAPTVWGAQAVGGLEDLQVPSGQWCLVRRPGIAGLMKAGVLHNVDTLSQIVSEKHLRDGGKSVDVQALAKDPAAIDEITHVVDRIVCHVVVQPEIQMSPNDVTNRKQGVIYADMVDLVDKMFIFNFVVGGTRDLESFRSGLLESVGSVESGEGVQVPSQ